MPSSHSRCLIRSKHAFVSSCWGAEALWHGCWDRENRCDLQDSWTSRAELAVKAGEDDLAREALKKKKGFEDQLVTWQGQLDQQEKAVEQLLNNTRAMEGKLQEAKSKKETLKARAASAKSSKQVQLL